MAKAERGQILASRAVVEAARTPLEVVPLEPFLVKGKSKPVHAFAVGRPTARRGAGSPATAAAAAPTPAFKIVRRESFAVRNREPYTSISFIRASLVR
jgi:hypothetical protein